MGRSEAREKFVGYRTAAKGAQREHEAGVTRRSTKVIGSEGTKMARLFEKYERLPFEQRWGR